jgi:hypothetical protein
MGDNLSISPLAPIVLFAYNRPAHLEKVINNLKNNSLSSDSDLYIFIDGPKNAHDSLLVKNVLDVTKNICGFKNVYVSASVINLGLARSVISGLNKIFTYFDSAIILEDDLIVSEHFLDFMNMGLHLYKESEDVCSIHGYMVPHKKQLPETFFLRGADCWGWATWAKYWKLFEPDGEKLLKNLIGSGEIDKFDYFGRSGNVQMLKNQIEGVVESWAIRWHASMFLAKKYTLYPNISLVNNIGFDLSGTSSNKTKIFETRINEHPIRIELQKVEECVEAIRVFNKFYLNKYSIVINFWHQFRARHRRSPHENT